MTISKSIITSILQKSFLNADIIVKDIPCSKNHYFISIKSKIFKNITLIQQHRLVQNALSELFLKNKLHAITIKTNIK